MMSAPETTSSVNDLSARYASALQGYLAGGGEETLRQAYEFGRAALLSGLGIIDMVELHHDAMRDVLARTPPDRVAVHAREAMVFFEESLSPFEITHRGYLHAVDVMHRVTRFASLVSHEVRGPLTSILSSAGMLQEMTETDRQSPQGKLIDNVLRGAAILRSRADDMMDIASLYSGTLSIELKPTHIKDFLRQVYDRLEPEVHSRRMRLTLDLPDSLPDAEIDPDRIEQVISNLVQNAVKYASEGRRVDLSAAARGNDLMIEVRDHGKGLSPRQQRTLFRADRPRPRRRGARSAGLGLMLCKQLVDAHQGNITLVSRPGEGSTFRVLLPLNHPAPGVA